MNEESVDGHSFQQVPILPRWRVAEGREGEGGGVGSADKHGLVCP